MTVVKGRFEMSLNWLRCPSCNGVVNQRDRTCPHCYKATPTENDIFVFGSNLAGIHGRGSALHARKYYGALQTVGKGRMGQAYAIPTKDQSIIRVLPLDEIHRYVLEFLDYARANTDLQFYVVAIGCGLAGFRPEQIAPMFKDAPTNVHLPQEFLDVLFGQGRLFDA